MEWNILIMERRSPKGGQNVRSGERESHFFVCLGKRNPQVCISPKTILFFRYKYKYSNTIIFNSKWIKGLFLQILLWQFERNKHHVLLITCFWHTGSVVSDQFAYLSTFGWSHFNLIHLIYMLTF